MKKLMLSIAVFMFVFGSATVVAQEPVKKVQPETEQTEEKKECCPETTTPACEKPVAEEPATEAPAPSEPAAEPAE